MTWSWFSFLMGAPVWGSLGALMFGVAMAARAIREASSAPRDDDGRHDREEQGSAARERTPIPIAEGASVLALDGYQAARGAQSTGGR